MTSAQSTEELFSYSPHYFMEIFSIIFKFYFFQATLL